MNNKVTKLMKITVIKCKTQRELVEHVYIVWNKKRIR